MTGEAELLKLKAVQGASLRAPAQVSALGEGRCPNPVLPGATQSGREAASDSPPPAGNCEADLRRQGASTPRRGGTQGLEGGGHSAVLPILPLGSTGPRQLSASRGNLHRY